MIIAVGGPPGSGKTTVAEGFAAAHVYTLVSAGLRFRKMAQEAGVDLEGFGRRAEKDPSIDRALDQSILEEILRYDAVGRDVIVDGRIQAHLLGVRRVPCLKVFIDAPLDVRARRVAGREQKSLEAAKEEISEREKSERSRYRSIYGIDLADTTLYDLAVDSSDRTPDAIVALVWARVEG